MFKSVLKRIFTFKFSLSWLFNPFISLQVSSMGNFQGVNECKREKQIIVTLTSEQKNFRDLPITIYSLLNQSIKPDRIILWIDKEYRDLTNLPYEITQFIKNGIEIRFVQDLRAYTKAIYAFKEFPEAIIVTAANNIYYPKNWLKKLYLSYISHPEDIHIHRAGRFHLDEPVQKRNNFVNEETARYDNFLVGDGGVLYPPNCFSNEVLRADIFMKNAPESDDIWFWVMALLHNRKLRVVKKHQKLLIAVNIFQKFFSSDKTQSGNAEALNKLMKFYGNNLKSKLINPSSK